MATLPDLQYIYPYESPTPGNITVVATGLQRGAGEVLPQQVFDGIAECNFNLVSLTGTEDLENRKLGFIDTLKNTQGKIGVLAHNFFFNLGDNEHESDQEMLNHAKDFYDFFKNFTYSAQNDSTKSFEPIKAWGLKDEPIYYELDNKTTGYNLRTIYNYIRSGELARKKADQSKSLRPVLVNLVGSGVDKFMTGIVLEIISPDSAANSAAKYNIYLDTFKKNFQPTLWSYDLYPITQKPCLINGDCSAQNGDCAVYVGYKGFYENLDRFNRLAKESSGVFWTYVQTMEFLSGGTLHPAAKESYLRFEIFSALAFGAQGILYWTYQQRPNSSETYFPALVDRHFNRYPAWYAAQKVNAEIKAYSEVFVGSKLLEFSHLGEIYTGCSQINGVFGPIKDISATSTVVNGTYTAKEEVEGKGVLLTRIKTGSNVFIIIVSHDVVNYQELRIIFTKEASIMSVNPDESGKLIYTDLRTDRTYVYKLSPGGYLVFKHNNA